MPRKHFQAGKLTAMLVLICLAAAFLLSAWFIVAHADHDCTGPDCATCAQIHHCANSLQQLGVGSCAIASLAWLLMAALLCALLAARFFGPRPATPVKLKVRLNN